MASFRRSESTSSFGSSGGAPSSEDGSSNEPTLKSKKKGPEGGNEEDDDSSFSVEEHVFSLLNAVCKEPDTQWVYACTRLLLEWLQLFLILVEPQHGWQITASNSWWRAFSFINLKYTVSVRGYSFFLACLYIWIISLMVVAAVCVWAARDLRVNNFTQTWLLRWVRVYQLIFMCVLDVAGLLLLLLPMDCGYFGVPDDQLGHMQTLPDIACWQMPHMIHIAVACIAAVLFLAMAAAFNMADMQLNPVGHCPIGAAHTRVEVVLFGVKMLMVALSVFVTHLKWMSVLLFMASFVLVYFHLRWIPHQYTLTNHLRAASFMVVAWAAFTNLLVVFVPENSNDPYLSSQAITVAMWVGCLPMAALGWAASWFQTQRLLVKVSIKFKAAAASAKPHHKHLFTDAREVEIACRCCRVWLDATDMDTLDEDGMVLGERIARAGCTQLPGQVYSVLFLSSYLMDVVHSYQTGWAQLTEAKRKSDPSMIERYIIFVREQDHVRRSMFATSHGTDGEAVQGLAIYVEYQRVCKLTISMHLTALQARRAFWVLLLHNRITFRKLAAAVRRIDSSTRAAERMYKQVLSSSHASSIELLSLYVKFLLRVRGDPWTAAKWMAEVEKLQHAEEEEHQRALSSTETDSQSNRGVIVMGANCIIRTINEKAARSLGWESRTELLGRNINVLIPEPFHSQHNSYVRRYVETGIPHVLGVQREFVALHRQGYVVPISVLLNRISGMGDDSVFMGVFDPVPVEPNTAIIWVMMNGMVLSCDQIFTDWFGYKHDDLHNRSINTFLTSTTDMEQQFTLMRQAIGLLEASSGAETSQPSSTEHQCNSESSICDVSKDTTLSSPTGTRNTASTGPGRKLSKAVTGLSVAAAKRDLAASRKAARQQDMWHVFGSQFKHMFLDHKTVCDCELSIGGLGATALFKVKVRRNAAVVAAQDLLMVADTKGRIIHVTNSLATRLNHTSDDMQAGRTMFALDSLIAPPFMRIHHNWLRDRMESPPAYSCLSGLTMCLDAAGSGKPVPFIMRAKRKELQGAHGTVMVCSFEERTHQQMIDERRLKMVVGQKGIVQSVSDSPSTLFSLDVNGLVGSHIAYILDAFQPRLTDGPPTPSQLIEAEEDAARVLLKMATKSFEHPGMNWRVGVTPVIDPVSLITLGPIGQAMMLKKTVPAVMVVAAYLDEPHIEGATMQLPEELQLQVELWRADHMCGVIDVDTQGCVETQGVVGQPVYAPHLLLGLPPALLTGAHLSCLLPCGRNHLDTLFTEGGLATNSTKPGAKGRAGGGALRGALRAGAGPVARRKGVGPRHVISIQHASDGCDVELCVQAIVKQQFNVSNSYSLYILLHVHMPRCSRKGFKDWIAAQPDPVLTQSASWQAAAGVMAMLPKRMGMADVAAHALTAHLKKRASVNVPDLGAHGPSLGVSSTKARRASVPVDVPMGDVPARFSIELPQQPLGSQAQAAPQRVLGIVQGPARISLESTAPNAFRMHTAQTAVDEDATLQAIDDNGNLALAADAHKPMFAEPNVPSSHSASLAGSGSQDGEGEEAEQEGQQEEGPAVIPEDDEYMQDVDMSGQALADLKRGRRLKKLTKAMFTIPAQRSATQLRNVSCLLILGVVVVDIVLFAVFWQLLQVQEQQVTDLRSTSKGVKSIMEVATGIGGLVAVLVGNGSPNVHHLGAEPLEATLTYLESLTSTHITRFSDCHHGVFRGFSHVRELPNDYGLRQTWEQPINIMRVFYTPAPGSPNTVADINMSLWDAGNEYIKAARAVMQNWRLEYPPGTPNASGILDDTSSLFVLYNAPRQLMTAYQETLDGLMQKAVADSNLLVQNQLIILMVEGVGVGIVATLVMLYVASKAIFRRYVVFTLFLLVPTGVIRKLSSQAFDLGQDQDDVAEEEGEGDEGDAEQGGEGRGEEGARSRGAGEFEEDDGFKSYKATSNAYSTAVKLHAHGNAMGPATGASQAGGSTSGSWLSCLMWWRKDAGDGSAGVRRKLEPSVTTVLEAIWPFVLWMVVVIMLHAVAYTSLQGMGAPIATSNVVQTMAVRLARCVFFAMRYASRVYFTPGFISTTAINLTETQDLLLRKTLYNLLANDYSLMRLEYEAMLYGDQAPDTHNSTNPHFTLATEGIIFSDGADMLYTTTDCLALDQKECLQPDHPFYQYTAHGLDQALKQLFVSIEGLLMANFAQVTPNNTNFDYIWTVGEYYIAGGLTQVIDLYSKHVMNLYQGAFKLHVVALALCLSLSAIYLLFLLRPQLAHNRAECKHVAQLLSCLPTDMDIETALSSTLQVAQAKGDVLDQVKAAMTAHEATKAGQLLSLKKSC